MERYCQQCGKDNLKMAYNFTTLYLELCAELLVKVFPEASPVLKKYTVKIEQKSSSFLDIFCKSAFLMAIVLGLILFRRTIIPNYNYNLIERMLADMRVGILRMVNIDFLPNINPDAVQATVKSEVAKNRSTFPLRNRQRKHNWPDSTRRVSRKSSSLDCISIPEAVVNAGAGSRATTESAESSSYDGTDCSKTNI
ncbi:uncharacterized protein LOC129763274 [Toxorhynchites rutilus septentrionalis]|uniref:uncharacterized protein LOC129763274 n=1 Tax=Toxorhynchites rutilus septentrionalis TaxID=329112 RepID=UPI00247AC452|nr:uncharacterized protein LOC129763274 [Toxorhynchites rutilus septentrionalis]